MTQQECEKQKQFMALFDPVNERLSRYIQSVVWNAEDARDIMGETVLIAFQGFEKIKEKDAFLYFLFGIASRLVKQRERKRKLWQLFSSGQAVGQQKTSDSPEAKLDLEVFYNALQKLKLKEREAIVMFEISGLSLKEIQEIQQDNLSAVKMRISRAKEKLAKLMGIDFDNYASKKVKINSGENNTKPETGKNHLQISSTLKPYGHAGKARS